MVYHTSPPIHVQWSIGTKSKEWEWITIEESSEEKCREKNVKTVDPDDQQQLLVPILGAALGLCLIVLITGILVYYCKVVKKQTEPKQIDATHDNPVYNDWDYDCPDDNYVKDVNKYYDCDK